MCQELSWFANVLHLIEEISLKISNGADCYVKRRRKINGFKWLSHVLRLKMLIQMNFERVHVDICHTTNTCCSNRTVGSESDRWHHCIYLNVRMIICLPQARVFVGIEMSSHSRRITHTNAMRCESRASRHLIVSIPMWMNDVVGGLDI